jgi:hypothetical protein
MRTLILFALLLGFVFQETNAQTKLIDWNLKEINESTFKSKLKTGKYTSIKIQSDSIGTFFKLRPKEIFGQLDSTINDQLHKILSSNYKVDRSKILFIHYIDTLPMVSNLPKNDTILIGEKVDANGNVYPSQTHLSSFETEKKFLKKEIKFFQRFDDVTFVHLVNVENDYPKKIDSHEMMSDPNLVFRKVLSDGFQPYVNILLYPDGYYLMTTYKMTNEQIKQRLNRKKFEKERTKQLFP